MATWPATVVHRTGHAVWLVLCVTQHVYDQRFGIPSPLLSPCANGDDALEMAEQEIEARGQDVPVWQPVDKYVGAMRAELENGDVWWILPTFDPFEIVP